MQRLSPIVITVHASHMRAICVWVTPRLARTVTTVLADWWPPVRTLHSNVRSGAALRIELRHGDRAFERSWPWRTRS
jgi:hypothetical protein